VGAGSFAMSGEVSIAEASCSYASAGADATNPTSTAMSKRGALGNRLRVGMLGTVISGAFIAPISLRKDAQAATNVSSREARFRHALRYSSKPVTVG